MGWTHQRCRLCGFDFGTPGPDGYQTPPEHLRDYCPAVKEHREETDGQYGVPEGGRPA